MANSASPAITVKEIDLTGVVPSVQSSTGAMVGNFNWGPIEDPVYIGDEGELATTFGTPSETRAVDFLSASQFLSYAGSLYVTRAVTSDCFTAASTLDATNGGFLIKNDTEYDAVQPTFGESGGQETGLWLAKFGGALGNGLKVVTFPAQTDPATTKTAWNSWVGYKEAFSSYPGTSPWAANQNSATNDELHIAVIDVGGKFSGVPGSVLETFAFVSSARGAKTSDGASNYFPDVVNSGSSYIRFGFMDNVNYLAIGDAWGEAPSSAGDTPTDYSTGGTWTDQESNFAITLFGGVDSAALTSAELVSAFNVYSDTDTITVDFLIANSLATSVDQQAIVAGLMTLVNLRKDCIVMTSPSIATVINNATVVDDTITEAEGMQSSSYLVMDNNFLKVYDKYNDQYLLIPAASSTAGICAASDLGQGPWFSPAGSKRGQYFGVTSLAYSATKLQRDQLYNAGVNPVVNLPGRGITLWGDKTKESRPSAFDRINVRRLFLVIERSIGIAARNVMFEFNDEFTRAEFVNIVEPYLREIKGRRGITEFYVQCDGTNNPPSVVDRNELIATIFVKPARSVNFVTLNFVAVRTGVDFEEIVGTV
jgi:phage tail sheath protein FI